MTKVQEKQNTFIKYYLYLTAFIVGAFILVIEIAGTRILMPFFGSTIFVWSALITVTLGALALGYYIGGKVADRWPQYSALYTVLFLAGATLLLMLKLNQAVLVLADTQGPLAGPFCATILLFAVPLFLLSMSEPFVIRLKAKNIETSGSAAGLIFGLSTLGSLAGAIFTAFYFIPNFLIGTIFIFTGVLIMILGFVGLVVSRAHNKITFLSAILFAAAAFLPTYQHHEDAVGVLVEQVPSYYADLKVIDLPRARLLFVNGAVQTAVSRSLDSSLLDYTQEFSDVLDTLPGGQSILVLGLGGGGVAHVIDSSHTVDYVEIDPASLKLAEKYFGFTQDTHNSVTISDARRYLRTTNKTYDIILIDLFNGYSAPPHMYTKEALSLVQKRLNEGGIVFANIIGHPESQLVESLIATYQDIFLHVLPRHAQGDDLSISIIASQSEIQSEIFVSEDDYASVELSGNGSGSILSDDVGNTALLFAENITAFREATNNILGYQPLFTM